MHFTIKWVIQVIKFATTIHTKGLTKWEKSNVFEKFAKSQTTKCIANQIKCHGVTIKRFSENYCL